MTSFIHQVILGGGRDPITWQGREKGSPAAGFFSPTTIVTESGGTNRARKERSLPGRNPESGQKYKDQYGLHTECPPDYNLR